MINFGGIKEELKLSMAGECESFRKVNEIKNLPEGRHSN